MTLGAIVVLADLGPADAVLHGQQTTVFLLHEGREIPHAENSVPQDYCW